MDKRKAVKEPIAIVGQSVLFPQSYDSTDFWRNIVQGRDLISDVPASHWLIEDYYHPDPAAPDKTYGKRGGFLPYVEFDALGWGVPPSIIEATDSTQLLSLMVAKQCLEDFAGTRVEELNRDRISIILGVTSAQKLLGHMTARLQRPIWENAMRQIGLPEEEVQQAAQRIADHYVPWQESTFPGLLGNVVAGRIANRLDFGGTNCVTDAACASAFSAISMAINELYLGDSDIVIAGGADTMSDILMHMCFSKTPALSKTGDVRPFSDQADGTLLGEGIALFAFKRLADAERDGDRIYGVLKGLGTSSDGRSKSVYAPLAEGQAKAYRRAYANAGIEASSIELVEAHGTGTKAGDAAEFSGLKMVFSEGGADMQSVALGSVKSQIGHTKATAGAAGFFKALMAIRSGVIPPTIKVSTPNPNLEIEQTPLYINTESRPWIRDQAHPRRAGISAFGFGGSNFHIVLEAYQGAQKAGRLRTWDVELCLYSGKDASEVEAKLKEVSARNPKVSLARLAWEAQKDFDATHPIRIAVVASSRSDLQSKIESLLKKGFSEGYSLPTGVHVGIGAPFTGKKAFLFPGQGAQFVNMGSQVAQVLPQALEVWDFSAELDRHTKRAPLHKVVYPNPVFTEQDRKDQQTYLTKTQWAQPAIGVTSMALLNVLQDLGLQAESCAGHSYGELTALYYAKTFKPQHFIQVSQKRGDLMNEAAKLPGAMTAVKASATKLQPLLDEWNATHGLDVVIANHNSPKQSVLSGTIEDIERIEPLLADSGLFGQRLGVATAFHSKVVAGSVAPFETFLRSLSLQAPKCTVYANRTAKPYGASVSELVDTLSKQIASPVRFVELVEQMHADGVTLFIEVGPKNILSKLTEGILRSKKVHVVALDRPGKSDLFGLLDGLGQLASLGVSMQWDALWKDYDEPLNVDALKKPKLTISINGANYNKPYPPKEGAEGRAKPNPPRAQSTVSPAQTSQVVSKSDSVAASQTIVSVKANSTVSTNSVSNGVSMSSPYNAEWLKAFQLAQQQTAAAHSAYQQAMSNAHLAYLQAAQASLTSLAALAGGQSIPAPSVMPQIQPIQPVMPTVMNQPVFTAAPSVQPTPIAAPVIPAVPVSSPSMNAPMQSPMAAPVIPPAPAVPERVAMPVPVASAPSSTSSTDVFALLMSVVAEKTGYPEETLELSMSLEGDLGIDSIKRVEILSAVQERAPELPEVDGSQMAQLQTLGEIVDFLGGTTASSSVAQPTPSAPSSTSSTDVFALLMSVVAEKTGYPEETLELSMSLEGDLGIDSIKRVEILSAVQERAPELPEVDGSQMAQLQTLGEIVGFLQGDSRDFSQAEASTTGVSAEIFGMSNDVNTGLLPESEEDAEVTEVLADDAGNIDETAEAEILWQPALSKSITRWMVQPTPKSATGIAHPALWTSKIAVLGDEDLTAMLSIQLQKRGIDAHVVSKLPLEKNFSGVIDTRALDVDSIEQAMQYSLQCFEVASQLAKNHPAQPKVLIHVFQMGGDFGFQNIQHQGALIAGAAGVVRTAQQEWLDSHCKNIDVSDEFRVTSAASNRLVQALVEEIVSGGLGLDVGLQLSTTDSETIRRTELHMQAIEPSGEAIEFDEGDIVVVSGGGRGVTADCIIRMAQVYQERNGIKPGFVLLGRTLLTEDPYPEIESERQLVAELLKQAKAESKIMKPAAASRAASRILACREIERTLQTIRSCGTTCEYLSVDVADAEAIQNALKPFEGRIAGVVHGAGVLADKRLQDKTAEDFSWVYDVKVQGMGALLSAVDVSLLKMLLFFSSVAARTGNAGQSDYAAGNEVLNRIAHSIKQRYPEMCVRSIGWGPWEGGMVTPALQRHFASRGVGLIPIVDGANAFVAELSDEGVVEVVIGAGSTLSEPLEVETVSFHFLPSLKRLLEGHTFQDQVLVPMAVVWTAFLELGNYLGLGKALKECRVFKPVRIEEGLKITVEGHTVRLLNSTGTVLYSAKFVSESTEVVAIQHHTEWESILGTDGIYSDEILFHTGEFQVLEEVLLSKEQAMGRMKELEDRTYAPMLEMDAGLQLALRWMAHCTEKSSLPMSIDAIQRYGENAIQTLKLVGFGLPSTIGRCDVLLLDAEEQLVLRLQGVQVVAPGGQKK